MQNLTLEGMKLCDTEASVVPDEPMNPFPVVWFTQHALTEISDPADPAGKTWFNNTNA